MDVAAVRLSKVTDRTNGLIWNLNGSQERRSWKGKGCGSAHPSRHMPGPTGSSARRCGKHNFVTTTPTCARCQRYQVSVQNGFGDSLGGVMQHLAQKNCQDRWWGWAGKGLGSFYSSLCLAAIQPGCWVPHRATTGNLKLFLHGWEKHWSPPSPFHWIKLLLGHF